MILAADDALPGGPSVIEHLADAMETTAARGNADWRLRGCLRDGDPDSVAAELNEGDSLERGDRRTPFPNPTSAHSERSESQEGQMSKARTDVRAEFLAAEKLRTGTVDGDQQPDKQVNDRITHPSGEEGGSPDGNPTRVTPNFDDTTRRSIELENSAAATFAGKGYQIEQNPTRDDVARACRETGDKVDPKKKPDYLIEGRVFDCYSPTLPDKGVRGIASAVAEKVEDEQTQRAVVNLKDWRGNITDLQKQFADWPIEGLKEVKVVTPDGDIVQIDLPEKKD